MKKNKAVSVPSPTHDFQAEDDLRTIERAAEVCVDKKRMSKARKLHMKRDSTLKSFLSRR